MANFTGEQNQYWKTYLWGATKNAHHVWNVVPFWMDPRDARTMCVPACESARQSSAMSINEQLQLLQKKHFCSVEFILLLPFIQLIYSIFCFQPINKCLQRKAKNCQTFLASCFGGRLITNNQPHTRKGLVLQIFYESTKSLDSVQCCKFPVGRRQIISSFLIWYL